MKNWKCIHVLLIAVCTIPLALAGETVVVKVPFDFMAGKTLFPPGDYVLTMDKTSSGTVLIRGPKSAILLAQTGTNVEPSDKPFLSFSSYGEKRFLSAIQTPGNRWRLAPSAQEVQVAHIAGQPLVVAQLRARTPEEK